MMAHTMTQDILEDVSQRAAHIRTLIDSSRGDRKAPTFRLNMTEGLRTSALLRDYLRESCKLLWKDLFENELEDSDFAGRMCLICLSISQKAYGAVREKAAEVQAEATTQDVAPGFGQALADFNQAVKDVEDLEQDFKGRWPWFHEDRLQRSIAEERQGVRRRSLKDIHDELRSRVR